MATTSADTLALGSAAPDFALPDTDGKTVRLSDFKSSQALLVMFICNHCPYVKHVADALAALGREYQARGVGVVAINSNDAVNYPDDSPAKMKEEKSRRRYTFPYLHDESQAVARAYGAVCTPEFFVFDGAKKLLYHGQFDDTRPARNGVGGAPATGADVRAALEAVLAGRAVSANQKPAAGCSIKWKKA